MCSHHPDTVVDGGLMRHQSRGRYYSLIECVRGFVAGKSNCSSNAVLTVTEEKRFGLFGMAQTRAHVSVRRN